MDAVIAGGLWFLLAGDASCVFERRSLPSLSSPFSQVLGTVCFGKNHNRSLIRHRSGGTLGCVELNLVTK